MTSVTESIFIEATPEQVKAVFYDFAQHREWNPFFIEFKTVKSPVEVGDVLEIVINPNNKPMTIKPKVLEYDEDHLLWQGLVLSTYLFSGKYTFEFIAAEQDGKLGTIFTNSEQFSGVLLFPLKLIGFVATTTKGFKDMNAALKKQVESK